MKVHLIDIHKKQAVKRSVVAGAFAALFLAGSVQATGLNLPIDEDYNARVSVTGTALPGSTVTVNGSGFKEGQEVKLTRDGYPLTTSSSFQIGADGRFTGEVNVPVDATVGLHPVVIQASNPGAAAILDFKVSPKIPLSNVDSFDIAKAPLTQGVYQVGYSKKNNALFVTTAAGRGDAAVSKLLKVDPVTLEIERAVNPPVDAKTGQLHGVFGVAVDDANGNVWAGNTRSGGVGVYRQSDLSLVKQFEAGTISHSFSIAIDDTRNRAYIADSRTLRVYVFDTKTLEQLKPIVLESPTRITDAYPSPRGLVVDEANGKLYVAVGNTEQLYVVDVETQEIETAYSLKGAKGVTGIAFAPSEGLLFVAAQTTDNLLIVNAEDGEIKHTVKTGAGPLAVAWDQYRKVAYVANRGTDSIAVVDVNGKLVANIPGGSYPNHLVSDGDGTVFAVNKARSADDLDGDQLRRIFKK